MTVHGLDPEVEAGPAAPGPGLAHTSRDVHMTAPVTRKGTARATITNHPMVGDPWLW